VSWQSPYMPRPRLMGGPPPMPVVPRERVGRGAPSAPAPTFSLRPEPALEPKPQPKVLPYIFGLHITDQIRGLRFEFYTVAPPFVDKVHAKLLVAEITHKHGLELADVYGPSRQVVHVAARHEAMVAVRRACPRWGLKKIGNFFGGRDHTTVLHALKQFGKNETKYAPRLAHLTDNSVNQMVGDYKEYNLTYKQVAERYKVSHSFVERTFRKLKVQANTHRAYDAGRPRKFTDEMILEVRRMIASGMRNCDIARKIGYMSSRRVSDVRLGHKYKDVQSPAPQSQQGGACE
jgi:transposase